MPDDKFPDGLGDLKSRAFSFEFFLVGFDGWFVGWFGLIYKIFLGLFYNRTGNLLQ